MGDLDRLSRAERLVLRKDALKVQIDAIDEVIGMEGSHYRGLGVRAGQFTPSRLFRVSKKATMMSQPPVELPDWMTSVFFDSMREKRASLFAELSEVEGTLELMG